MLEKLKDRWAEKKFRKKVAELDSRIAACEKSGEVEQAKQLRIQLKSVYQIRKTHIESRLAELEKELSALDGQPAKRSQSAKGLRITPEE